jgi:hypothetical protein
VPARVHAGHAIVLLRPSHRARILSALKRKGPCQFPTLGFVAERYKMRQAFQAREFWSIQVKHTQTPSEADPRAGEVRARARALDGLVESGAQTDRFVNMSGPGREGTAAAGVACWVTPTHPPPTSPTNPMDETRPYEMYRCEFMPLDGCRPHRVCVLSVRLWFTVHTHATFSPNSSGAATASSTAS